jgi:uncharacterized membrane protein
VLRTARKLKDYLGSIATIMSVASDLLTVPALTIITMVCVKIHTIVIFTHTIVIIVKAGTLCVKIHLNEEEKEEEGKVLSDETVSLTLSTTQS